MVAEDGENVVLIKKMDANVVVKYGKKIPCFIGVFLIEGLKKLSVFKPYTCLIIITNSHAVALRFEANTIELFDPLGLKNTQNLCEIFKFLKRHLPCKRLVVNTKIQSNSSVQCAKFSLLFLFLRNKGYTFNDFLNLFSEDYNANDSKVRKYFKTFFTKRRKSLRK